MSAALRGPSGFIRKGPMYLDADTGPTTKNQPKRHEGVSHVWIRGTCPWWLGCRISTVLYWPPGQNLGGIEKRGKWKGLRYPFPHPDCRADWSHLHCWHESNSASLNRWRYSTTVSVWPEQRACKNTPWGLGLIAAEVVWSVWRQLCTRKTEKNVDFLPSCQMEQRSFCPKMLQFQHPAPSHGHQTWSRECCHHEGLHEQSCPESSSSCSCRTGSLKAFLQDQDQNVTCQRKLHSFKEFHCFFWKKATKGIWQSMTSKTVLALLSSFLLEQSPLLGTWPLRCQSPVQRLLPIGTSANLSHLTPAFKQAPREFETLLHDVGNDLATFPSLYQHFRSHKSGRYFWKPETTITDFLQSTSFKNIAKQPNASFTLEVLGKS